jgi:hypothetical protein
LAAFRIAEPSTSTRDDGIPRPGQAQMKANGPAGGRGRTPIVHVKGPAIGAPAGPRPAAQHRAIRVRRIGTDGGWAVVGDRAGIGELDRQPQDRIGRQRTATVMGELRERPESPPLPRLDAAQPQVEREPEPGRIGPDPKMTPRPPAVGACKVAWISSDACASRPARPRATSRCTQAAGSRSPPRSGDPLRTAGPPRSTRRRQGGSRRGC